MKVGRMRYRIRIQSPSDETDIYANPKDEWTVFKEVWADIVPVSGREYFAAQQAVSETQFKIYIRYLEGVSPKMRVLEKDTAYEILAVLGDKRSGMLTLMVKVIV